MSETSEIQSLPVSGRKPRIVLMGEFSSGKSTLANLLMEQAVSPVKVIATQLPPVWYSEGDGAPFRITHAGEHVRLDAEGLSRVGVEDTRAVRVFLRAGILGLCDLIDAPGTSDPNMDPEVWQAVLEEADAVIWCTPATQAWRQSEAAVWEEVPLELQEKSLLLVTRMDKILSETDRTRVFRRVERAVEGCFHAVYPISLTEALEAEGDPELWEESGAAAFTDALVELLEDLVEQVARRPKGAPRLPSAAPAETGSAGAEAAAPEKIADRLRARQSGQPPQESAGAPDTDAAGPDEDEAQPERPGEPAPADAAVLPRRVAPPSGGGRRRARPGPGEKAPSLF
ncbi:hypothetical protein [Rhodosalinus sp. K401]|uniref:hypothetical protein n=1 Tax=Rhodosalinus sp. K401 TaxID=3239195 RepID=UPI003525D2D7